MTRTTRIFLSEGPLSALQTTLLSIVRPARAAGVFRAIQPFFTTKELAVEMHDTLANDDSASLLSAEKLAALLDISVRTLWRLRAAGKLPAPVRLGGSVRWRAQEIAIWIERGCPVQSKSKATSHG